MKLELINERIDHALSIVSKHKKIYASLGCVSTNNRIVNIEAVNKALKGTCPTFFLNSLTKNKGILSNMKLSCALHVLQCYSAMFLEQYTIDQTI